MAMVYYSSLGQHSLKNTRHLEIWSIEFVLAKCWPNDVYMECCEYKTRQRRWINTGLMLADRLRCLTNKNSALVTVLGLCAGIDVTSGMYHVLIMRVVHPTDIPWFIIFSMTDQISLCQNSLFCHPTSLQQWWRWSTLRHGRDWLSQVVI